MVSKSGFRLLMVLFIHRYKLLILKMLTKVILFFLITITQSVSTEVDEHIFKQFLEFREKYNKTYSTLDEFISRYNNFKSNLIHITAESHKLPYNINITKFSDMSLTEFKSTYLNLKLDDAPNQGEIYIASQITPPEAFDWRDKNVVTPVKDQGSCGSCWAFATVANLESLHAIQTGKLEQYSEQQLVDCDNLDLGCWGGYLGRAYDFIKQFGGITTEHEYPYTAGDEKCLFNKTMSVLLVSDKILLNNMDENDMKSLLYTNGPFVVGINADPLMFYTGGILDLDETKCDPKLLSHAVTLIGYGNADGKDFWIVKNSWGEKWGEKGYFRIARGKGTCGINKIITSGVLPEYNNLLIA
jgi:cathepsin F